MENNMPGSIEGLAIEVKNVALQVSKIEALLFSYNSTYVRNDVFDLRMKEQETKYASIMLEIEKVRSDANNNHREALKEARKSNWKSHTLTAILTAVLISMIGFIAQTIFHNGG